MNRLQRMGLAVMEPELEKSIDWLIQHHRDVELQDICERYDIIEGDWKTVAQKEKRLLQHHKGRIGVHAPFWDVSIAALDPTLRRAFQARYHLGLDYAEETGAEYMVLHSPFYSWGHAQVVHRSTLSQEIGLVQLTLEPILKRASELGITLVIENILDMDSTPLTTLVKSFNSPYVKVSIDVGHAHINAARGAAPAQQWLVQTRDVLGHIHIQDNDSTSDDHLAPEKGTIHWASVVRALRQTTTDPYMVLEIMPPELEDAMRWVDNLHQKLNTFQPQGEKS